MDRNVLYGHWMIRRAIEGSKMKKLGTVAFLVGSALLVNLVNAANFRLYNDKNSKRELVTMEQCVSALENGKILQVQTVPSTKSSRLSIFFEGAFYEFEMPDIADGVLVNCVRLTPKGL